MIKMSNFIKWRDNRPMDDKYHVLRHINGIMYHCSVSEDDITLYICTFTNNYGIKTQYIYILVYCYV